jgi:hypothetical protein
MDRVEERMRPVRRRIAPTAVVRDGVQTRFGDFRVLAQVEGFVKEGPSANACCGASFAGANPYQGRPQASVIESLQEGPDHKFRGVPTGRLTFNAANSTSCSHLHQSGLVLFHGDMTHTENIFCMRSENSQSLDTIVLICNCAL